MVDFSRQGSYAAAPRPGAEGRVADARGMTGRMLIEDCLREPEEQAHESGGVDRPRRKLCPVASASRKFLFRYLSSFKKRSGGGEGSPISPRAPLLRCRHSRRKGKEMPREEDGVEKSASFDSMVAEELGGDATVGSMEPVTAYGSSSSSENGDPQEDYYNVHGGGISARELERRLYELINTRQQERIAELESALELTTKSLGDKELKFLGVGMHQFPHRNIKICFQ